MKILIDARLYGSEHTGPGRYTQNLIENLAKIDKKNRYVILLRKDRMERVNLPDNFQKVEAEFRHYSFAEQLKVPQLIWKYKPDLVHFPFFNVPILYFGKFVVTIHDLIMHRRGKDASTRDFPLYFIWKLGYHLVFAKGVYGSSKIIVPSNSVKAEVLDYYHVNEDKIAVTYE
jgi:glycosyltransferase involved in cell wall biosynthesis